MTETTGVKSTTGTTQLATSDGNVFSINSLVVIMKENDETLKNFVDYHLYPAKSELDIEDINNNIEDLKKMNNAQQALVKGRAKSFEELNDPSKYFPSLIAIFGILIGLYTLLREMYNHANWVYGVSALVGAVLTLIITVAFIKTRTRRDTAVFFSTLLDSIDYEEK